MHFIIIFDEEFSHENVRQRVPILLYVSKIISARRVYTKHFLHPDSLSQEILYILKVPNFLKQYRYF